MKHATPAALADVERLLAQIRTLDGLVEKKPGTFYRKSKAFLHFHEDPTGMYVDVRVTGDWERFRVTTAAEQRALMKRLHT